MNNSSQSTSSSLSTTSQPTVENGLLVGGSLMDQERTGESTFVSALGIAQRSIASVNEGCGICVVESFKAFADFFLLSVDEHIF